MKTLFLVVIGVIATFGLAAGQNTSISADDLKVLEGGKWTGNLVYLDSSSDKKVQIKSDLTISRKAGDPNAWIFVYEYPDAPKANESLEVTLTDGGTSFNGGCLVETRRTSNGAMLQVVTTRPGIDDNRKALFRFWYLIGGNVFTITKEVQLEGSTEWIRRSEYSWSRPGH